MISFIFTEFILRNSYKKLSSLESKNNGKYASPFKLKFSGWYDVWEPNSIHYLKTPEYCFERHTNSLGLSDKEHSYKKHSGEYRIMGLGDSFTEGDGAHADSTWLKFLERNLQKKYGMTNLTFINAGVCGSDPYEEYKLLNDKLLILKPDLVIVSLNSGDISDIVCRGGIERFQKDSTLKFKTPPIWEDVYANSYIFRLIIHNMFGYDFMFVKPSEHRLEIKKSMTLIIKCIIKLNELALENKFKLLLVFHPFKFEINRNFYNGLEYVIDTCKRISIDYLNMLDYYTKQEGINKKNSQQLFWLNDGHHNANGYSVYSRGVEWKLKQMGVVDTTIKFINEVH